jgi:hypothetical protein
MRLTRLLNVVASAALALLATSAMAQYTGSCSYWNGQAFTGNGNTLTSFFDTAYHSTGDHYLDVWRGGTCSYTNVYPQPNSQCIASVDSIDTGTARDEGSLRAGWAAFQHVVGVNQTSSGASNYGAVTAPSSTGTAVVMCLFGTCGISVTISANGILSETLTGSSTPVWSHTDTNNAYCPSKLAFPQTPIMIDTANEGFQLTDLANGVVTDMVSPGHSVPLAWTRPGSHNAFLWLDGHLFGNSTPQPPSADPNGFRALAVYDSNGDGVIDAKDPVFANLRLWIDANHDGVVQSDELFTLSSLDVYSISLHYVLDKYTDGNGNAFRYRGHIKGRGVDHTIYDVWLSTK